MRSIPVFTCDSWPSTTSAQTETLRSPRSPPTSFTKGMFEFVRPLTEKARGDETFNTRCNNSARGSRSFCGETTTNGQVCSRPSSVLVSFGQPRATNFAVRCPVHTQPSQVPLLKKETFIAHAISSIALAKIGSGSCNSCPSPCKNADCKNADFASAHSNSAWLATEV